jgi:small GTP-binding protein
MTMATTDGTAQGLNPNHVRALSVTFAHLAHELSGLQAAVNEPPSPLAAYANDLTPEQQAIVIDHLSQLRDRLVAAVRGLRLRPPEPVPLSRALSTSLIAAQIALEELSAERLRGYGLLDAETAERVATVVGDLDRTIRRLSSLLARPATNDLSARIKNIGGDARWQMLSLLERIVTRHGFVELRPSIVALLELIETSTFEVAVFGRVSCGKSTLLNAIVGAEILPVGATPVTAVATRLRFGPERELSVRYPDGRTERLLWHQLRDYVTEEGNPSNRRGVASVIIDVPGQTLSSRVVLVDTPGVGSLTTHGARETFAYLPRCDLGVLVIDATTAVSRDDTDLVHRLSESGIEVVVVLSKCDLLAEADRERVRSYFSTQLEQAVGRPLTLDLLSARAADGDVKRWVRTRILARCAQAEEAVATSAARKLAALHATVVDLLRASSGRAAGRQEDRSADVERIALAAEQQVREVDAHATAAIDRLDDAHERAFAVVARRARSNPARSIGALLVDAMQEQALEVTQLLDLDLTSASDGAGSRRTPLAGSRAPARVEARRRHRR